MAAADTNGTAAASPEQSAAKVSFQRHHGSFPPDQNVNSADLAEPAAGQFSGSIANCAENAVTIAISATF